MTGEFSSRDPTRSTRQLSRNASVLLAERGAAPHVYSRDTPVQPSHSTSRSAEEDATTGFTEQVPSEGAAAVRTTAEAVPVTFPAVMVTRIPNSVPVWQSNQDAEACGWADQGRAPRAGTAGPGSSRW